MGNLELIKETVSIYGADQLSDIDFLMILLGEEPTKKLEKRNICTINNLKECTDKELLEIDEISENTLLKIKVILELIKRNHNNISKKYKMKDSNDAFNYCKDIQYNEQEVFKLICLNTKNEVIKDINLFKGGLCSNIVDIKILMKEVLKYNSASFIVCHNHPSGDPTPSQDDKCTTLRIKNAGDLLSCRLLDHIIIGDNKYVSMKAKELI